MEKYNYMTNLCEDIKDYIQHNEIDIYEEYIEDTLIDRLWCEDSVTGNGSGSYTFNAWAAEENICHNLDLLAEACSEFGCDASELLSKGAEGCDVTIRCYLLSSAIAKVLNELKEEE